jgi:hypothetical protein
VISAGIPTVLYLVARSAGVAEVKALVWTALVPAAVGAIGLARTRSLNPIAAITLFAIAVSLLAAFAGGDSRLLLIRESFVTGALGLACLVSLALPRPMMFWFGRWFATRGDRAANAVYDALWARPGFRRVNRIITVVWAFAFLAEFGIRVTLVYLLPSAAVLAAAPFVTWAITIATLAWTYRYVRAQRARSRA